MKRWPPSPSTRTLSTANGTIPSCRELPHLAMLFLDDPLARRRDTMLALVNTPSAPIPVELHEVAEPEPAPDEAIVEVHAFSLNRGELALLAGRPEGWRPGQDIAGVVVKAAADGSGPKEGTRVVALVDGAGWAQRAAAPTARMATLPDNVSFNGGRPGKTRLAGCRRKADS